MELLVICNVILIKHFFFFNDNIDFNDHKLGKFTCHSSSYTQAGEEITRMLEIYRKKVKLKKVIKSC